MAAAIAHTHFVAHTYHMDVKPGNSLLDADFNLVETFVLIDREMVVQQDDAEQSLNLMLDEHLPDSRGQKISVRGLRAGTSIRDAWQRVVVLSGVRKVR